MTTEVSNTEPADETDTVKPDNNHVDGGAGVLASELTTTSDTGTVKPDNNHVDSEPTG
jgi:hypothetical protein